LEISNHFVAAILFYWLTLEQLRICSYRLRLRPRRDLAGRRLLFIVVLDNVSSCWHLRIIMEFTLSLRMQESMSEVRKKLASLLAERCHATFLDFLTFYNFLYWSRLTSRKFISGLDLGANSITQHENGILIRGVAFCIMRCSNASKIGETLIK